LQFPYHSEKPDGEPEQAFQPRRRDLWEDDDTAVRMQEEFDSVARFEMKMIPMALRIVACPFMLSAESI
jgi:hypothetical protein